MFRKSSKEQVSAGTPGKTARPIASAASVANAAPARAAPASVASASGAAAAGAASARSAASSAGKLAYEARRAAKAGVSLDRWMADKQKRLRDEQEAERKALQARQPGKPGLFKRLLDRAHKPI